MKTALKDYLRESGVTLDDILDAMDEGKEGILEALSKRFSLDERELKRFERVVGSRDLNLILFVTQTFYIINVSGGYKGRLIYPTRDSVMVGDKVTLEGLNLVLKALGIHINSS